MFHPTQDPKKQERAEEQLLFIDFSVLLKSMENLLKSSIQVTNKSYSALKDTYVTLTNMNQSRIEIADGTEEIRVFRLLY